MYSSLSICAASWGSHAREGEEGTIEDMQWDKTKRIFIAETPDLKLELRTCTVPLAFVEYPVACMWEKKERTPTWERERENRVSGSEFNLHSPQASMDGCLYLKVKINLRVALSDALKSHLLSMGALSINWIKYITISCEIQTWRYKHIYKALDC